MFTSLLVPLDRSPVAERALPFAVTIAERAKASLDLVEVHRSYVLGDNHASNAWMLKVDPEREAEARRQEEAYLADAAARATGSADLAIATHVLSGTIADPATIAESVLEAARTDAADLIVMTTRARNLVTRVGLGSVADQLVRRSPIPVLLVWPGEDEAAPPAVPDVSHVLIPLDGSALSEQILAPAVDLARLLGADCTLFRVVAPKAGDAGIDDAERYLEGVAASARTEGLDVATLVAVGRNPGDEILRAARTTGTDLIALATHGYGGLKRLVLGSVADRLIQEARLPVLVRCPTSPA